MVNNNFTPLFETLTQLWSKSKDFISQATDKCSDKLSETIDQINSHLPGRNKLTDEEMAQILAEGKQGVKEIKETFKEGWQQLMDAVNTEADINYIINENTIINMPVIISSAKEIIVPNANGILAYYIIKDNMSYIYLANVYNKELLSPSKNKYAIIKGQDISSDVRQLFIDNNLVILK